MYGWNAATKSWTRGGTKLFGYDQQANLTSQITILGETDALSSSSFKTEISYNPTNKPQAEVASYWDISQLIWIQTSKTEYRYDSNANMVEETSFVMNADAKSWVAERQYQYEYDANGNRSSRTERKWDTLTQGWANVSRIGCSYDPLYPDESLLLSSHCMTSIFNSANANVPTEGKLYDWNAGSNEWNRQYTLSEQRYYSGISLSGLNDGATNELKIYPNPVTDKLVVANAPAALTLRIYNLQGVMLVETHASELDVSGYPAGIYLLDVNGRRVKIVKK